jgi:hypothetical protein
MPNCPDAPLTLTPEQRQHMNELIASVRKAQVAVNEALTSLDIRRADLLRAKNDYYAYCDMVMRL